jgi:hypothetical protein
LVIRGREREEGRGRKGEGGRERKSQNNEHIMF